MIDVRSAKQPGQENTEGGVNGGFGGEGGQMTWMTRILPRAMVAEGKGKGDESQPPLMKEWISGKK